MSRAHDERNRESLERLRRIVERADDATLGIVLPGGWTVAATLAHIGFWDQSLLVRWDRHDRDGVLVSVPDDLDDLVNDSLAPYLAAIPPRVAADLALRSMAAADARTAALPDGSVALVRDRGEEHLLDRSEHRDHHAAEIEAALGG